MGGLTTIAGLLAGGGTLQGGSTDGGVLGELLRIDIGGQLRLGRLVALFFDERFPMTFQIALRRRHRCK